MRSLFNYSLCFPNKNLNITKKIGKLIFSGNQDTMYTGHYHVNEICLKETSQLNTNGNISIYGNLVLKDFSKLFTSSHIYVFNSVLVYGHSILSLNASFTSQFDTFHIFGSSTTFEIFVSKYFDQPDSPILHVNQ